MPQESFELECDRLSHVVDSIQYERLRWSRIEGPMLVRLVELAQSAMQGRPDFELIDEGSTSDVKRFVLKVHGNRISGLTFHLDQGQAVITAFPIERSRYRLAAGPPVARRVRCGGRRVDGTGPKGTAQPRAWPAAGLTGC